LTSSESVLRVTPRAVAAVMLKPKGSMQVIDIINVRRAIIETENHPPVCPNGHSPEAFHLAFEWMQPEAR
jgi:hypothetical protein